MNPTADAPLETELPWPTEMEADELAPPTDDFDLARLWRRIRRDQAEIDRLKRYQARVVAHVQDAVASREARVATLKQLTIAYLDQVGARKAVLPDLGTVHLATRRQVVIDVEAALVWAQREATQFVLVEPRLDRDGLKRHLLTTGEIIPDVAAIEEVTSVAFRPR